MDEFIKYMLENKYVDDSAFSVETFKYITNIDNKNYTGVFINVDKFKFDRSKLVCPTSSCIEVPLIISNWIMPLLLHFDVQLYEKFIFYSQLYIDGIFQKCGVVRFKDYDAVKIELFHTTLFHIEFKDDVNQLKHICQIKI